MDNPRTAVKNSFLRGRNTEQGHILKMRPFLSGWIRFHGLSFNLFDITVSKDLRQFHGRTGIIHQPWCVFFNPKLIVNLNTTNADNAEVCGGSILSRATV